MKTSLLSLVAALGIFATTSAYAAPTPPPFKDHKEISRVERERATERARREAIERRRRDDAERARQEAQRRAERQRAAERARWEAQHRAPGRR